MNPVSITATSSDRNVTLILGLVGPHRSGRLVVYPKSFRCDIDPANELASSYSRKNWESGILDGLFAAFRQLAVPHQQIIVERMGGRLGSEDMTALTVASAIGVTNLLGGDTAKHELDEWTFTVNTCVAPIEQTSAATEGEFA